MSEGMETGDLSRAEASAILAWWLDAGVDTPIQEEPRDWRKAAMPGASVPIVEEPASGHSGIAAATVAPAPPTSQPAPAGERESLPGTLEAFHAWLAETADLPLFRAGASRALPHGPSNAELMLVAGIPGAEDVADGRPIGGDAWALTKRMLAAVGLAPEQAYVTALTCFSATGTRFSASETEACRDTMLAQIALAAPKRLLLFGDAPSKLLLGQPMANARGKLHKIAGIPAVVTFPPRHLLQNSSHKPLAWSDLQLIMGE